MDIARLMGVSCSTLRRRVKERGLRYKNQERLVPVVAQRRNLGNVSSLGDELLFLLRNGDADEHYRWD